LPFSELTATAREMLPRYVDRSKLEVRPTSLSLSLLCVINQQSRICSLTHRVHSPI
jgi:hypothetical protein